MQRSTIGFRGGIAAHILLAACALVASTRAEAAAPLEFSIDQTAFVVGANDTASFRGVITNRTGHSLSSDDLFLSFADYDFNVVEPTQTLGMVAFTLPNATFSSSQALFDVLILPAALPGTQTLQVTLQDVYGNVAGPIEVSLLISAVPEASSAAMLALGLALVAARRRVVS